MVLYKLHVCYGNFLRVKSTRCYEENMRHMCLVYVELDAVVVIDR